MHNCQVSRFVVSLMILAMKSQSHDDYVISHAFQLKKKHENNWFND